MSVQAREQLDETLPIYERNPDEEGISWQRKGDDLFVFSSLECGHVEASERLTPADLAECGVLLPAVRALIAADPAGTLAALGLAAGGDLYRGDGEGGGYFTRAFYLPK